MPIPIPLIEKALDVIKIIFSADERRKRRQILYNDNIRRAVNEEEKHYVRLFLFFDEFIVPRINLRNREDKREWHKKIREFERDRDRFFKLT